MTADTSLKTVSIVIPAYNYARFLPATLGSVLGQTHAGWECIVVDDGSTDDTREVVAEFTAADKRFRYVHQSNKGLPGARNTGIKEAAGRYIQFLDADDLIEAHKLEEHSSFLQAHPEVDIVYGESRYFTTERPTARLHDVEGENRPWMPKASGRGKAILAELLKMNIMPVNAPLVRREVFRDCGMFDETLKSHEDWEFWLRCARMGKSFFFLDRPETFALVRSHGQSMSRARIGMFTTDLAIRRRIHPELEDSELRRINRFGCARTGFALAVEHLKAGNKTTGIALLLRYGWQADGILGILYGIKLLLAGFLPMRGSRSTLS